jgi:uncharacterized protein (TIRG00374 family)
MKNGWRGLAVSVALSAVGYLAFSLWGGWHEVTAAIARVGWAGTMAMLGLSVVNYVIRFLRWQVYLSCLGHRVAWRPSLIIYLSGFALTTTPGKAGEAIRSVFLKPYGVGYGASMAAFFSERLSDLLAIVLLATLGLTRYPSAWPLLLAGAAAVVGLLVLLSQVQWLRRLEAASQVRQGRLARLVHGLSVLLIAARQCHAPRVLAISTVMSLLAWGAEACAFHVMLDWLGLQVDFAFAVFVYSAAMLAGALSFLPGGLGGAEATMVSLLLWLGQPQAPSVAATVLIRLTTLWFAVVLGLLALGGLLRRRPGAMVDAPIKTRSAAG